MAKHVRLRAPQRHGQILQLPKLAEAPRLIAQSRNKVSAYSTELQTIRGLAFREIPKLALQYSSAYLNELGSDSGLLEDDPAIVMSGHQPTLFHPGVWFKNFSLSSIGQSAKAIAINLIVDNDLSADGGILCPSYDSETTARLQRVHFDVADVEVPFEMRRIRDMSLFQSFSKRVADSISSVVQDPLVNALWREVENTGDRLENLHARIAAGRHRLESQFGLRTLELPVSWIARSKSFAMFVERIVGNAEQFIEVHNQALMEYRRVNRIRSKSHPVPALDVDDQWCELPFWVWLEASPIRRRLFAKRNGESIVFSNRAGWSRSILRSDFASDFFNLNQAEPGVFIRPRAFTTTMFCRLFASDLFLHGIGGAKYDQLNDEIIKRFFNIVPPDFMTVTATMKLPFDFTPVSQAQINEIRSQLRDLKFHPETFLDDAEATDTKRQIIEQRPTNGSRKSWHEMIEQQNAKLGQRLADRKYEAESTLATMIEKLPTSRILGSREFSFALFPESLVEDLAVLAETGN